MHTYVLQRFANSTNSRVYDYEHNHYAADVYRSKGAFKKCMTMKLILSFVQPLSPEK